MKHRLALTSCLCLLAVSLAPAGFGQETARPQRNHDQRIEWLRERGVPVSSVDPSDSDFSDLMPLSAAIGSSRVVLLGEQTHGDGVTFLAKARLIRFLHQVMGFDVLVWEADMYACRDMDAAMRTTQQIRSAAGRCIYPVWANSGHVGPLLEYVRSTQATTRPLEMAGIDCQSAKAAENLQKELLTLLDRADARLIPGPQRENVLTLLGSMGGYGRLMPEEREKRRAAAEDLLAFFKDNFDRFVSSHSRREIAFLQQTLENVKVFMQIMDTLGAEKHRVASVRDNNPRDQRMGENLIWLAKERYPDRKIIVWAASFHNARNAPTIDTLRKPGPQGPGLSYDGLVTMGHIAHEAMGDLLYSIAFVAYQGKVGIVGRDSSPLAPAPEGSLEALLHEIGAPYQFLDFRSLRSQPDHWLRQGMISRPLGNIPMKADWTRVFDGAFYIETQVPSTTTGEMPHGVTWKRQRE